MVLAFSKHKLLKGVLHDGLYKSWSNKLLSDYTDDFNDEDDDDKKAPGTAVAHDEHKLIVKGPLNSLYPLILNNMIKKGKSK